MKRTRIRLTILFALTTFALTFARCVGLAFEGQETLDAPQFRAAFETPPPGYGEVPFWWWTGEKLDPDRLKAQVLELSRKGIPGVQVNYAHQDVRNAVQPNWLTYPNDPEVFTDEWFDVFEDVASYCNELNMGIGLSGYTLDWQHSPGNLFDRLLYSDPKLQSRDLYVSQRVDLSPGKPYGGYQQARLRELHSRCWRNRSVHTTRQHRPVASRGRAQLPIASARAPRRVG